MHVCHLRAHKLLQDHHRHPSTTPTATKLVTCNHSGFFRLLVPYQNSIVLFFMALISVGLHVLQLSK